MERLALRRGPLSVGAATFTGLSASGWRMRAVALEATVCVPSAFVAETRTRIRWSTSAVATMYFEVVAPPIAAQSEPSARPPLCGQRTHWYAKAVGWPVQEPFVVESVAPTTAEPLIRGSAVFAGLSCAAAPPPPGSASTVAADASAATTIVLTRRVVRVLRIDRPFGDDDTGLAPWRARSNHS